MPSFFAVVSLSATSFTKKVFSSLKYFGQSSCLARSFFDKPCSCLLDIRKKGVPFFCKRKRTGFTPGIKGDDREDLGSLYNINCSFLYSDSGMRSLIISEGVSRLFILKPIF